MANKKVNSPLLVAGLGLMAIGGFYYFNQNGDTKNNSGGGGSSIVGYLKPNVNDAVTPTYTTTETTTSTPINSFSSNALNPQSNDSGYIFTETNKGTSGSSGGGGGVITKKGQKINPSFTANDPTGIYTPIENINSGDIKTPKPNTNTPKPTTKKGEKSTIGGSGFLRRIGNIFTGGLFR